ncbi:hypothetical protein IMSAGC006_02241 [Muribaculaceae bacterium]|nr:hypothetical protein IMSAGC006_02241 [Muribaculaceae bacterium]
MKFVSKLLVWNGVRACLFVELPFLDGIAVGVEKVKSFFGVKAFIVFFRRFCGNGGKCCHHPRFGEVILDRSFHDEFQNLDERKIQEISNVLHF